MPGIYFTMLSCTGVVSPLLFQEDKKRRRRRNRTKWIHLWFISGTAIQRALSPSAPTTDSTQWFSQRAECCSKHHKNQRPQMINDCNSTWSLTGGLSHLSLIQLICFKIFKRILLYKIWTKAFINWRFYSTVTIMVAYIFLFPMAQLHVPFTSIPHFIFTHLYSYTFSIFLAHECTGDPSFLMNG